MSTAVRLLGLDRSKWVRVGPGSLWPAAAFAVAASTLMALNRFGGLVIDTPRAFTRLALVGVYGWLALALALWATFQARARWQGASTVSGETPQPADAPRLVTTVAAVGLAHAPILALGIVVFAAANLGEVLGPGTVVAVFVFAFWFPGALVAGARFVTNVPLLHAIGLVAVPYLVWLHVVGRHLLGQVAHLL